MKKIIIIGAGIAGMSAGIYAQKNGFETEIYEMHNMPGGECTGWDRGGYHFDGCIHFLMGAKSGSTLNKVWRKVGALDDSIEIYNSECFYTYEEKGSVVKIYRDADRLEKHLLEISPQDREVIQETCKNIKEFCKLEMPMDKPMETNSIIDNAKLIIKMRPILSALKKYNQMTVVDFAKQFKSPLLQNAFSMALPKQYSVIALFSTLASMNDGDSGWPMGGSKQMSMRMEKKYLSLGGKAHYQSIVEKIIIQEGKAMGVKFADGSEKFADYVISAADGNATLQKMLEGKYSDPKLDILYSDHEAYPTYTTVQVSVGLDCDLSMEPDTQFIAISNDINAGGILHNHLSLKHFCYDPAIAPQGKSVITTILDADFDWWKAKYENRDAYKLEKKRIAAEVCAIIEEKFPQAKGKIEQIDVATPMTYVRFFNAWRGSWMSWMMTPKGKIRGVSGRLKGLDNFYLTGQWTMPPGGLPGAVVTGKWTIQRICKDLKMKFEE